MADVFFRVVRTNPVNVENREFCVQRGETVDGPWHKVTQWFNIKAKATNWVEEKLAEMAKSEVRRQLTVVDVYSGSTVQK